ncbi:hypothetical protein ZIOFF_033902 [Zingiber officinale]|uniref:CCHC-type domain-containing protein n=1 Tax=Zingiber officinale TaxID=94328 RepID=A0A8J5GXN3_ZINOF|nr:hypothetical protein ZIOFF_033902 [Zingiber officinale]
MEATDSKSVFGAFKLDRFDGTNFTRWKDKLFFLLTELGVAYLLLHDLPPIPAPTDKDTDEIRATRKKWEEDEVRCRGYILNALTDRLYDLFRSIKSPQEIWNALENKYTSEKQATGSKSVFGAFKLDRFDGTNFTRWKDKLFFLLTELGVAYLLLHDLPLIPAPTDKDTDEIRATRKKWEEDEVRCRGYILNALTDRLYDLFRSIKSPQEIWNALENKYTSEKQGTDRFLSMKFFEFRMIDNKSIMDQVDELLVLVSRLKDLKIEVSDPLQVATVIAKLPTTWNGYRKKLLHTSEDFTIDQLIKHIRIEEETRIRENKFAYESGSKVNNLESKKTKYSGKKRKFAETSPETFANKKKTKTCYFCGKKGHYKNECRFFKRLKVEGNVGQKTVSVFERPPSPDIVAMIADLKIGMITECNMATSEKSADWWYDSGASVHVCNERNLFKNYELATKEEKVLMGNHDTAIVLGKGTIEMQFTSGKKMILTNVLHVPDDKDTLVMECLN